MVVDPERIELAAGKRRITREKQVGKKAGVLRYSRALVRLLGVSARE